MIIGYTSSLTIAKEFTMSWPYSQIKSPLNDTICGPHRGSLPHVLHTVFATLALSRCPFIRFSSNYIANLISFISGTKALQMSKADLSAQVHSAANLPPNVMLYSLDPILRISIYSCTPGAKLSAVLSLITRCFTSRQ